MKYNTLTPAILSELERIAGAKNVITDIDRLQPYAHDEVTDPAYHRLPDALVLPETTEQTAAIVKLANKEHFPVVPRGAGTGLACGSVPIYGGLVVSLEKMNRIEEINEDALYAVLKRGYGHPIYSGRLKRKGCFMQATRAAATPVR